MENKLFKINGVGLDLETLDYNYSGETMFNCVHTSISANNDYLCKNYLETYPDTKVVTSVDFLDNVLPSVIGHLLSLGRESIDVLLIDSACDFGKYKDNILELLEGGYVKSVGLKNPVSPVNIEQFNKALNTEIHYVSLEICPMNFNFEVISWCNSHDIDILGFNPFGGYLSAPGIISSFTIPYLLSFAATYCHTVFLTGRMAYEAIDESNYLRSLIGQESKDVFNLKKSIFKLQKPLKKAIYSSLVVDKYLTIPFNSPTAIYDYNELEMNLGKEIKKIAEDGDVTEVEKEVLEVYDTLHMPVDGSDLDFISIIRPKVMAVLELEYPELQGWYKNIARIGEKAFVISLTKEIIEKKWFIKNDISYETQYYVMYYSEGIFLFQKVQNSAETTSEP